MRVKKVPAVIEKLQSPRLLLEPLMAAHATALYAAFSDVGLYDFIPQDPPVSEAALTERYRRLERRQSPDGSEKWWNWAVRLIDMGRYVGLVETTIRSDGSALLAYFVFSESAGRGYGREAVGAVLHFLFDKQCVTHAVAYIDTRNTASIRLVENLGFRRVRFHQGR